MPMLTALPAYVVAFVDQVPKDEDVKAGWVAFAVFIGLILAVALLGRSLVTQLRKAKAAEEAGLYDPSGPRRTPGAPAAEAERPAEPGSTDAS